MAEIHPFKPFVPKGAKYLLLGSFPGRADTRAGEWYYETQRGQFWKIMSAVYQRKLTFTAEKIKLMTDLKIALSDTIFEADRTLNNNADSNLKVTKYNTEIVETILAKEDIKTIYFSSRFVERLFKSKFKNIIKKYPNIKLIALPSSSPRYAKMEIRQKIDLFKKLLPPLDIQ